MPCQEEQELWCIFRGDTVTYSFLFWDEDNNAAIDISSTTLTFTMKRKTSELDSEADLQKSVVFPSDTDSQNGIGYLKLEAADTEVLTPKKSYFYDFQWLNGTDVTTMGTGKVPIKQDVTLDVP